VSLPHRTTATAPVSQFREQHSVLFARRGHDALAAPFGFWFALKAVGLTANAFWKAIDDPDHAAIRVKRSHYRQWYSHTVLQSVPPLCQTRKGKDSTPNLFLSLSDENYERGDARSEETDCAC
jgi:hypothetical protein